MDLTKIFRIFISIYVKKNKNAMKTIKLFIGVITILIGYHYSFGQQGPDVFSLTGSDPETIEINQTFTMDDEIYPFPDYVGSISGLALSAQISLEDDNSLVRVILVDEYTTEYLVYEAYSFLNPQLSFSVDKICEETCMLNMVNPHSIRLEVKDASINLVGLTYTTGILPGFDIMRIKQEQKQAQNIEKIKKINASLKAKGLFWVAGLTNVADMSYAERKQLYGQGTFPNGFEYYVGGVISTGTGVTPSSPQSSLMVEHWDWRDRHGQDWMTSVKS
jgi:hypothetical protein